MSEIIAIANQKGGVGKTTTAINFSAALAALGQDTLLVDLDAQGNATSGLGFDKAGVSSGIYHALLDSMASEKTIKATGVELLDLCCSSPEMVAADLELSKSVSRENRLKNVLDTIQTCYRFIVIDCPPSLGLLTINALTAADKVIIPIQGEYYALEGLAQFLEAINRVQSTINSSLSVEGGLLTMFDPRYSLSQQVQQELGRFFGASLFSTYIPRSVRLAEAPSFGKTIFQYEPRSKGSETYLSLAGEFLARRGWKGIKLN